MKNPVFNPQPTQSGVIMNLLIPVYPVVNSPKPTYLEAKVKVNCTYNRKREEKKREYFSFPQTGPYSLTFEQKAPDNSTD